MPPQKLRCAKCADKRQRCNQCVKKDREALAKQVHKHIQPEAALDIEPSAVNDPAANDPAAKNPAVPKQINNFDAVPEAERDMGWYMRPEYMDALPYRDEVQAQNAPAPPPAGNGGAAVHVKKEKIDRAIPLPWQSKAAARAAEAVAAALSPRAAEKRKAAEKDKAAPAAAPAAGDAAAGKRKAAPAAAPKPAPAAAPHAAPPAVEPLWDEENKYYLGRKQVRELRYEYWSLWLDFDKIRVQVLRGDKNYLVQTEWTDKFIARCLKKKNSDHDFPVIYHNRDIANQLPCYDIEELKREFGCRYLKRHGSEDVIHIRTVLGQGFYKVHVHENLTCRLERMFDAMRFVSETLLGKRKRD